LAFEGTPHDGFQPDRGALSQDGNISINERTVLFSNVFMFGQIVFPCASKKFRKNADMFLELLLIASLIVMKTVENTLSQERHGM
jgi:hypothetical protein